MHDGCSGSFGNGRQVVDKVRMMGFADQPMAAPLFVNCRNCNAEFEMETYETKCPACDAVHAVTPCHAFDPDSVVSAGVGY